jgi:hypothetical protein
MMFASQEAESLGMYPTWYRGTEFDSVCVTERWDAETEKRVSTVSRMKIQSASVNKILVEFRKALPQYRLKQAEHFLTYLNQGDVYDWRHYGEEMKAHARRVLERYLAVVGEPEGAAHAS